MSIFTKSKIGKVVKITQGRLQGKYAMIAKEYEEGYGVVTDSADWPSFVPLEYNALFMAFDQVVEISAAEETMISVKFPNPDEFE